MASSTSSKKRLGSSPPPNKNCSHSPTPKKTVHVPKVPVQRIKEVNKNKRKAMQFLLAHKRIHGGGNWASNPIGHIPEFVSVQCPFNIKQEREAAKALNKKEEADNTSAEIAALFNKFVENNDQILVRAGETALLANDNKRILRRLKNHFKRRPARKLNF